MIKIDFAGKCKKLKNILIPSEKRASRWLPCAILLRIIITIKDKRAGRISGLFIPYCIPTEYGILLPKGRISSHVEGGNRPTNAYVQLLITEKKNDFVDSVKINKYFFLKVKNKAEFWKSLTSGQPDLRQNQYQVQSLTKFF